jgi:ribosomal-protein-alanine N-acetyltransferase
VEIEIYLERFILKTLKVHHVTDEYLSWFDDGDTKKYINYKISQCAKDDLKDFVREKDLRNDVLFLGIFDKFTMQHIGNIKYEPINFEEANATMGILLGASDWRGKGVGPESIKGSALWMKENWGITKFFLGVDCENVAAVKAYNKIGFKKIKDQKVGIDRAGIIMEMSI